MEYLAAIYLCLMALYALIHGIAWIAVILDFMFNLGIHEVAQNKQKPRARFPR